MVGPPRETRSRMRAWVYVRRWCLDHVAPCAIGFGREKGRGRGPSPPSIAGHGAGSRLHGPSSRSSGLTSAWAKTTAQAGASAANRSSSVGLLKHSMSACPFPVAPRRSVRACRPSITRQQLRAYPRPCGQRGGGCRSFPASGTTPRQAEGGMGGLEPHQIVPRGGHREPTRPCVSDPIPAAAKPEG